MAGPAVARGAYYAWRKRRWIKRGAKKLRPASKWAWKKRKKIGGGVYRTHRLSKSSRSAYKWRKKLKRSYGSKGKSSSGITRGRTVKRRKTMRAPRHNKPKFVRYRKGGCPPGYVYDSKRKMCIQKRYR